MSRILIVDDDKNLRFSFKTWMKQEGYEIDEAPDGISATKMVAAHDYDVVVMDIRMPGMTGLEAFKIMQEQKPALPVIITTAYGTTETAIETMRLGAYDYVLKPMELPELKRIIATAIEDSRLVKGSVRLPSEPSDGSGDPRIVGSSPPMQEVYKLIGKVSRDDTTVLITGPSGSGKELVARAIYNYSARKDKPFQAVNCAALPDQLLESELFGHEKGAFTGAHKTKIGRFERCDTGTLFLDELGDMSLMMQAKVLRVLQEQSFERVGGTSTIDVDVRILGATNRDLEALVKNEAFREDLYYRLGVVHIRIPPLCERRSDIPELVEYFIRRFNRKRSQSIDGVTEDALEFLKRQPWQGNVRELQNAVQRAMVLCPVSVLREEDFSFLAESEDTSDESGQNDIDTLAKKLIMQQNENSGMALMAEMEKVLIKNALEATDGNQVKAAKLLGMNRNTLHSKIKKYFDSDEM